VRRREDGRGQEGKVNWWEGKTRWGEEF